MTPLIWLLVAALAGAVAYLIAWPAVGASRARARRDLNAERYLAWRGRADRRPARTAEGMTSAERRRIGIGIGLAAVSVASLIAFLATS